MNDHAPTPSDPTARVLLPVLLHEVNNATQLLVGLKAILELPGGEPMFNSRADDLGRTSSMMDDLGFALAVVATAGGANMLLARRDERSMRILWDLASKALTRHGGPQVQCLGEPPLTAPAALDGWQLAWAAAALLISASGDDGARLSAWSWEWGTDANGDAQLLGRLAPGHGRAMEVLGAGALELLRSRLGETSQVNVGDESVAWRIPGAWVRTAGSSAP